METAKTSQSSGLRKFGQMALPFGIGREIPGHPDAADVDAGINARAHDGEDGHRLRRAVDAGGPALAREIKNGGDHRSGVADADPEDEVGDVPRPVGRVVFAPDADAGGDEIKDAERR